jgi:hypothetical protein
MKATRNETRRTLVDGSHRSTWVKILLTHCVMKTKLYGICIIA